MMYLQQEVGPLDEDLIAWILKEVLKGLDYLHSHRIAYGNLSTHNILFSLESGSLEVKLANSHAVIDELDVAAAPNGSETDFDRNYLQVSDGTPVRAMKVLICCCM